MRLATAIEIYAGGPGSGCKGENCGRPSTGASIQYPQRAETGKPYQVDVYHSSKDGKADVGRTGVFFHTEKGQSRLYGDKTAMYRVDLKNPLVYDNDEDMFWNLEHGKGPFDQQGARLYQQLQDAHAQIDFDPDPEKMIADPGVRGAFANLDSYIKDTLQKQGYDGVIITPNWRGIGPDGPAPMLEVRKFTPGGIIKLGGEDVKAGGEGSGCHGPNCGRPVGSGKGKTWQEIAKSDKAVAKQQKLAKEKLYKKTPAPKTSTRTPGTPYLHGPSLRNIKPAYKSGVKTEFNPDEKYKPPTKSSVPEKEEVAEQTDKFFKEKFKQHVSEAKYQLNQQEIINKQVLQPGDKVVLLKPVKTVAPTPPFKERVYPAGYEAKFHSFGQEATTDLDRPDKLSGSPQVHITFGKSKYTEQVPLGDIQLLEKAPLPFTPEKAKPSQTVMHYRTPDGANVTIVRPKGTQGTGEHERNFWKLEHPQKGAFSAETGFIQGIENPKRFTQVYFASAKNAEHGGTLFPTTNEPAKHGTAVFIDRYQGSSKVTVTEVRTGQYGYQASAWQRSYQNRNAADAFLKNRYGIKQSVPKGLKQSKGKKA